MSCGLGAVILIFMLIKLHEEAPVVETDFLQSELDSLELQKHQLAEGISSLQALTDQEKERIAILQAMLKKIQKGVSDDQNQIAAQQARLDALKELIKKTPIAQTSDVVSDDRIGEENYLMGLKVEGRKIALLIDASASMTDEKLIEIIRRKNGSERIKKNGPKWIRTKKIVRWLLARLPQTGQVSILAFNQKVKTLGNADWLDNRNPRAIAKAFQEVEVLVPQGTTNLQKGLQKVSGLNPTDLYVITDGLPTSGESSYGSLNPFASCSSLLGRGNNISGPCRVMLFRQTIQESAPRSGVKVHVILLPIEGDPEASPEFWSWTSATGGLLISPAENWP
ncbi:MAG: VWA domain-containing protein [Alphaproteobacteria bacterium]|nr:VWA domain-containing protein [Alphaproteobacteria bacterium]